MGALAVITVGIDPHKASLTAVAVDPSGRPLGHRRLLMNAGTLSQLVAWTAGWPARRFAVEGAFGLGRPIAQQLAAVGEQVLDVPATLAARARLLSVGGGRKTNTADAASVAQVALHCSRLRAVAAEVAGTGVTANAVCPTFVRTDMTRRSVQRIVATTGRTEAEAEAALVATSPLGRLLEPEEVAFAVTFLAAPEAAAINGQTLVLDGGGTS
jgi:NAD(P)-dependent dehydrogenase (short-subunit alcohol dehydrogenase family)